MKGINGRIIFAFVGLLLLGLLIGLYTRQPAPEDTAYIFDRATGPAIEQIAASKEQITAIKTHEQTLPGDDKGGIPDEGPPGEGSVIKDLFSQIIVSSGTTLHYFTWLGHEFRQATSREDHLAQVKEKIFSQFPPEEAGRLYATYQRYLDCEIAVADLTARFGPVTTAENGLELLRKVQEFRRGSLGRELADKLFGEQVKEKEYSIRRAAIVNDGTLYAADKQTQLDRLTQDMWGDSADSEAVSQGSDPYEKYQAALAMHQKDLAEITGEAERQAAIDDIRNQYLQPDAVERIKDVERQAAERQQQEQAYFSAEKKISEDTSLSEEAREEQIDQLRQQMLGDQAEAMKRREAIETARQEQLKKAGLTPDSGP
ncbi:MAG: lipase secretion chaperone [Thermodesulfobacteriota bacterium]